MKLRHRKRLLNAATAGCVVAAGWIVIGTLTAGPPSAESISREPDSSHEKLNVEMSPRQSIVNAKHPSWQRELRHPLYDPPPPPKVVVKKKPRPITVKLTGTVLEPQNSQAFLRLPNGSVALKRIGDQVTDDPRDGRITDITASEIIIQREEDETRLRVDGQN